MKFSLFLVFLLAMCYHSQAQTDEQIQSKSKGYLENRSQRTSIRGIPAPFGTIPVTETQLVVIDNKIFKATDPALKHIVSDSLVLINNIKDETSTSGIRQILFYRTKDKSK